MERFIEKENIALFTRRLAEEPEESRRRVLLSLLKQSRRRLATIEADSFGARSTPPVAGLAVFSTADEPELTPRFRQDFEGSSRPLLLIDPRPGLRIVDANPAYVSATMIDRNGVIGQKLFDVFPDNPEDPVGTGVANLFASLREVTSSGRPHAMDIQRYDVRDPAGTFVERYWQPLNTPIFDAAGKLAFILHQVIDVSAEMRNSGADSA